GLQREKAPDLGDMGQGGKVNWTPPQPGGYPGGWWNPINWQRGLLSGDPNLPDEIYNAALQEVADDWIHSGKLGDAHRALQVLGPLGIGTSGALQQIEGGEGHKRVMEGGPNRGLP